MSSYVISRILPVGDIPFAIIDDINIAGGLQTVDTIDKLNNINKNLYNTGMIIYVKSEDNYYKFNGNEFSLYNLSNSNNNNISNLEDLLSIKEINIDDLNKLYDTGLYFIDKSCKNLPTTNDYYVMCISIDKELKKTHQIAYQISDTYNTYHRMIGSNDEYCHEWLCDNNNFNTISGLVPEASSDDTDKFLCSNGTFNSIDTTEINNRLYEIKTLISSIIDIE